MIVKGKIIKWNVLLETFTIETPIGDIDLGVHGIWEDFLDDLIDAMKNRKTVSIEVEQ